MKWTQCVIDASMGCYDGLFTYCPIEGNINGNFVVVEGMNYLAVTPPNGMKLVAIVHPDGQTAVEQFCERYADELQLVKGAPAPAD